MPTDRFLWRLALPASDLSSLLAGVLGCFGRRRSPSLLASHEFTLRPAFWLLRAGSAIDPRRRAGGGRGLRNSSYFDHLPHL
jgi:hypothetical protein